MSMFVSPVREYQDTPHPLSFNILGALNIQKHLYNHQAAQFTGCLLIDRKILTYTPASNFC